MNTLKSAGVILLALVIVGALSHLTDLALEKPGIMTIPFANNPLWLILFVTVYRTVYVVVGGYVTTALAPTNPMRLIIIFTCIGTALGIAGAIAMWHEPPHWYPVALVVLGIPAALLGGLWRLKSKGKGNITMAH